MAASASASSPRVLSRKYDLFISFKGSDVRSGFLSHLKKDLCRKNINVYVDDRLERGEEISSALVEAIEGSMIALVIFSKDYAFSRWCLEELVKIMECKEAGRQIVIPVFYHVDPSDVRHQKGTYEEAFTRHKEKFKDNMQNLQIWRSVLEKTANLSGYHSLNFRYESELINAIVECILKKWEDNSPIDPRPQLIGFHQNFISVEALMEIESLEVRVLGIWSPGGIGKTTLARATFDKFLSKFESHCFLANVRGESSMSSLLEKLLSMLLDQKVDHKNMNHAIRRLKQKKVLIVLDDVDNPKQLKDLVVQQLYLRQGSRVIATSRDKHVLRSGGIYEKYIHEVIELSLEESLVLFSTHAFNQTHPIVGYEQLSNLTVALAQGIPLALEVLGSHFHSRDKAYWKSELNKLQKCPNKDIQNILKVSYDGLDYMDKQIFLDIAFFFLGHPKDEIAYVLEACGFKAVSGIQNLIDKALIKSNCSWIKMHDSIRAMAEQIVREECMKHPERRSRLKDADEICNILKSNKDTNEIEGIILDVSQIKYLKLRVSSFSKMKNLRILKVFDSRWWSETKTCIELPLNLDSFPDTLTYFWWDHYPLESLPLGFCPKNLVELRMIGSNVTKLWDGVQDLGSLRTINLSRSHKLRELPDFSKAYKLENVCLSECSSLRSVHPSILSLHTLVELSVSNCDELESLENETHLESLSYLRANYCGLKKLCLSSKKLTDIRLRGTKVEILHLPIGGFAQLRNLLIYNGERLGSLPINELCCLTNLERFEVRGFKQEIHTEELHSLFDAWRNLRRLRLMGWSYLSEIPSNIKCLTRLTILSLKNSSVETLPACVSHLSSLTYISLRGCKRLKSILGVPPMLQELKATDCTLLQTVSFVSPPLHSCSFYFENCVKLDECSLRFIEELTHSSMTSALDDDDDVEIYYPGNRVPEWMKYKQMTEASNTIEFTCNLERAIGIGFCCVARPDHLISLKHHLISLKHYATVNCYFTCDDNNIESGHQYFGYCELNSNHVILWRTGRGLYGAEIGGNVKISCEFFLEWLDQELRMEYKVPVEACGVHVIYESESESESELEDESGQKRKRVVDIGVEDRLPPIKQLNSSRISQPTLLGLALELGLATTKPKKSHDNFICHPLQLKFILNMKEKDPLQLKLNIDCDMVSFLLINML